MRVLVVEDDDDLARQLRDCLVDAGYVIDVAPDGEEGHYLGANEPYDAVVLDLGLPLMDGITVLERWRREGRRMPVLILTARDRWSEKVAGFDAGADDYVAKPFHMEEVLARLRALVRRAAGHASAELVCGPVQLDTRAARVAVDGQPVRLTAQEYRLLAYLMHHPGPGRLAHRADRAPLRSGLRSRFQHHRGVRRPPAQEARRRRDRDGARPGLPRPTAG